MTIKPIFVFPSFTLLHPLPSSDLEETPFINLHNPLKIKVLQTSGEGGEGKKHHSDCVYAREALLHNDSAVLFGSGFSVFHAPSLHKKNSEVVFRRSEIENSTSEVDGCGNEEIGRRTLPLSEMLKSS